MPKILLVEDNASSRDMLSRLLNSRGFDVVIALDGKEAIARAESERPDLILMDMNLPELDGWEAARQIKASPAIQTVPIIGLTAHAQAEDRERALAVGCVDYHAKPIEFDELLEQIEQALRPISQAASAAISL